MTSSLRTRFGRPELYTSYEPGHGAAQHHAEEGLRRRRAGGRAGACRSRSTTTCCSCWPRGASLAIGAIGLNIVTGYAGQVSLGHAFFVAIGAYTAAVLSGDPNGRVLGFGITEVPVWLLAAGAVAALAGALVAPLAVRLRGLYLAIVTLGLVFIGQYVFRRVDGDDRRPPDIGRPAPVATLFGTRIDVDGAVDDPRPAAVSADAGTPGHLRPAGTQPRPVAHRPGLRRDPRPGHRRRGDRRQPDPVQGDRVRGLVVLRRGRRRAAVRRSRRRSRRATSTC